MNPLNQAKPANVVTKTESLNFKKQPVKTKQDPVSLLRSDETGKGQSSSCKVKSSCGEDTVPVAEKKARFAGSVVTHEYVESESEVKAKSKNVTSAVNAQKEVEKVENECKQS